jgi:ABC-2 type transport system permease protein
MITDIATIVWKELRELFLQPGRFRGGWVGMLLFIAVFGIFMPLQSGSDWVNSPLGLVYWSWVPFMLVSSVVSDAIAGERERHTLETLLASRLSDRAILFGKIAASIAYGWGIALVSIFLGLITINLAFGKGSLILYPVNIGTGILALSFLVSTLAAGLGVLISLRAATVRQAQQTFSIAFFAIFIPLFVIPLLPEDLRLRLFQALSRVDFSLLPWIVGLVLLIIDATLIWISLLRFKRSQLILD